MNGLDLSNRFDHWAVAILITLAAMAPLTVIIDLTHAL
jgi:hypothetical protein